MNISRVLSPAVALVALVALAGCGNSTPTVDKSKLEDEISSKLEAQVGTAPDDISCPKDLKGKKGTTMRCTLTAGEDKLGVTVTVTSVDGKQVNFDAEVDQMDDSGSSS
ncbi:DUF4333 domain-containing protein [Nocardioides conyzicola]|uniref:DUF4333 domain-containing protein n=1 Tax=Nocardioides conyzicola TaxID=1651781 RepID=UPI0031E612AB